MESMKKWFSKKIYSLEDISGVNVHSIEARKKIKIALIDDVCPEYFETLKNNKYQIEHFFDVNSIEELERFDVVVCDIQGVGKNLSTNTQGGLYLMEEVKRLYPLKYIIAISSRISLLIDSGIELDNQLTKEDDICDKLKKALEMSVTTLSSSKEQWIRIRNHLLNVEKLDLNTVSNIEQKYIKSLMDGKEDILLQSKEVKSDASTKELFTNLSHSAIWDGIKVTATALIGVGI